MNPTLTELDREWRELCRSTASRVALEGWTNKEPVLTGLPTLEAVLVERKDDVDAAPAILAALSRLAVDDDLAARTLLQALMPGLVKMASTCCSDDPAALDELLSLAWVRIRTYPVRRPGPVAANVLMDVRSATASTGPSRPRTAPGRRWSLPGSSHLLRTSCSAGAPSATSSPQSGTASSDIVALGLILRTRVDGVSLELAAAEQESTVRQANCIRWRAERRIRPVLALVS